MYTTLRVRCHAVALVLWAAGCLAGPACSHAAGNGTVEKGKAACRALRSVGLMPADRPTPERTAIHGLGPGWRGKHPGGNPTIEGVFGVGGEADGAAAGSKIQWWVGVFPSLEDARADLEDHRLWPPKLERSPVESDLDEGYTSTDTSAGRLTSESGGEALMPAFPYVEGRFRCGRLVIYLLWQRVPRSPVPPGDARVAWARGAYPEMRLEGRGTVTEMARRLHRALIAERACWCTSSAPVVKIDPVIALELANVPPSVVLGAPITGVATVTVRGIAGSASVTVTAATVQGGTETSVGSARVTVIGGRPSKLSLSRDLSLAANGAVKAGPAVVVVTAEVTEGGETRRTTRRAPVRLLPSVRKVMVSRCALIGGGRVGERTRIELSYRLTNLTKSPLRVLVTDRVSVSGPRNHAFQPTSRQAVVPAGDVYGITSMYPVTYSLAGTYTVDCKVECSFAQPQTGRVTVHVTDAPVARDTGGARKTVEPPGSDAAAARSKHSSARFLLMSGKAAEAEAALRDAVRLDPSNDTYWETLYLACVQQEKWPEAEVAIRKAADLKPDKWEHHNNLAIVLKQRGKLDEAVTAARTALKLGMPKDAFIVKALGITP